MTEPTDNELDAVLCNQWPAFSMQATLVRVWVRAAMRDALAKWGTPPAVAGEPVAWRYVDARGHFRYVGYKPSRDMAAEYPLLKPIRLYLHPSPPEGMAVTDAMIDAGKKMLHNSNGRGAREKVERIFNAMIALAAPPTAQAEGWTKLPGQLPEPGTPVLLDIGEKYPIRAMWAAKHTVQAADDDTDWGEYVEADDMYYAPEGWYEWNQCEDSHWRVTETPRAWMPLPPTSAEGVGS